MRRALERTEAVGEDRDAALDRWVAEGANALSVGLVSIENLFDPEIVVIGGTAPASLLERLVDRLGELRPSVRQDLGRQRVRVSALGEQSASLGASALPILAATSTGHRPTRLPLPGP
jgi:predicted NBD/HSP70 family sugar kinase